MTIYNGLQFQLQEYDTVYTIKNIHDGQCDVTWDKSQSATYNIERVMHHIKKRHWIIINKTPTLRRI